MNGATKFFLEGLADVDVPEIIAVHTFVKSAEDFIENPQDDLLVHLDARFRSIAADLINSDADDELVASAAESLNASGEALRQTESAQNLQYQFTM